MAFKSLNTYNEERYGNFFTLPNDGDHADVIFLYHNSNEALVADVHYIKSNDYSGYVHCCNRGCPACGKNIRIQTKLFIPMYNITEDKIQFWDRTTRFEPQLQQDVFKGYPNPSEYVFRITRKGAARDVNTTYQIQAVGKNSVMSIEEILAKHNATFPDYYSAVCKELTPSQMSEYLNSSDSVNSGAPIQDYSVTYGAAPRSAAPAASQPTVTPPTYSAPPEELPLNPDDNDDDGDLSEPEF